MTNLISHPTNPDSESSRGRNDNVTPTIVSDFGAISNLSDSAILVNNNFSVDETYFRQLLQECRDSGCMSVFDCDYQRDIAMSLSKLLAGKTTE